MQTTDTDAGLAALDAALARDPRDLRALIMKADHFAGAGDGRAANSFYAYALKIASAGAPLTPELHADLARAQQALARSAAEYEAAVRGRLVAEALNEPGGERMSKSLDIMLGKTQAFYQEPTSYFFPELPQRQFYEREEFDWIPALEAATDDIRRELLEVLRDEAVFTPYFASQNDRPQDDHLGLLDNPAWSAFYLWERGALVEENAARCPRTVAALRKLPMTRFPSRTPSVLFSLLRPGAHIPPHNGMVNCRLIGHLPLIVPKGCALRVGNETRQWVEGRTLVFDDSIQHEAWNRSAQTRVILLFDVERPELSAAENRMVAAMFGAIDAFTGQPAAWGD